MPRLTRWKPYITLTSRFEYYSKHNLHTKSSSITIFENNRPIIARTYSHSSILNMPLVVPGINSGDGNDQTQNWMQKLMGKKITETGRSDENNFAKSELPQKHRVLSEDSMMTMDHNPER